MTTLEKKICMMGAPGVGKTSLVRRFVESIFSDKYLSTVGVKIDRKVVPIGDTSLSLLLWDLQGEERYQWVRMQYLRGASGFLLVVDGTRPKTLEVALGLQENAESRVGQVPFVLILNKADLKAEWQIDVAAADRLRSAGWIVLETSAKTGENVNEAFEGLGRRILGL
ncbi:MAG TPA: Rab family GTPase [Gemmatimonadales bacterium]|nr:Rab family GTPase [Gemmatimonadales bacterium]